MTVKHLPKNNHGKDYIIGDLHGHVDILFETLDHLNFNPTTDRVIATGDLIDRGPNNIECILLLEQPWFHSVKGNHEQFAEHSSIDFIRQCWFRNGGSWAYDLLHTDEWMTHKDTISNLPTAIVVGSGRHRYNVIHAEPPHTKWRMNDTTFDNTPVPELEADVMWSRELFYYPTQFQFATGLSTTFVGHNTASMLVKAGPIYFLDRNAHRSHQDPAACLAVACPQDKVIYEYHPPLDTITTTKFKDVPDMSHPSFEEDYVYYPLNPSPPA